MRWLVVISLVIAAATGACTLFDEDPPDDSCTTDNDCFRAQGEVCIEIQMTHKHKCEVKPQVDAGVDAGVDAP